MIAKLTPVKTAVFRISFDRYLKSKSKAGSLVLVVTSDFTSFLGSKDISRSLLSGSFTWALKSSTSRLKAAICLCFLDFCGIS